AARTSDGLAAVTGACNDQPLTYSGRYYRAEDLVLEPKPVATEARHGRPRPTIYAGGESEAAKTLIARKGDAYVMHGDPPERIAPKIDDLRRRREAASEALRR